MKTKTIVTALSAACFSLLMSGVAFGQACTANSATITAVGGVAGTNCNHVLTQSAICTNGETLNGTGVDIYGLTVTAGNNFTATVTSSVFSPELAVTGTTTCSGNAPCVIDVSPPGAATSPFSVSGSASNLAAGTYYIFVADVGADSPGCGAYNLTIAGSLGTSPVELKNFSID